MLFYLPTIILFLYLLFRLILPSRLSRKDKVVAVLILFLVTQSYLIKRLTIGGSAALELPVALILIQGWLFTSVLVLFVFTMIKDIFLLLRGVVRLGLRLVKTLIPPAQEFSTDRRRFLATGASAVPALTYAKPVALATLVLGPTAYGVAKAVAVPDVHHMEVPLARLPQELNGLKIVHVTDVHVSPLFQTDWVRSVVDRINALNPDLIVFTGDMVDGSLEERAANMTPLRDLRAQYGIYACTGNHEYYSDFPAWMRTFPDLGLNMLHNSHAVLNIRGEQVVVAGLTDVAAGSFGLPMPDIQRTLSGAPEQPLRILLDHRPGNAAVNARHGVDLQLSGHTHGGQAPGMAQLVERFNEGYVRGWYTVEGMPMYVNTGAGLWNGFPIRLGVPAELACMTLRRG